MMWQRFLAAMLTCVECGCCSGELGRAWSAWLCEDPDGVDEPLIAVYCPPCAAREFGYRPDVAANYVCAWEPLPSEPIGVDDA
jgi:hypothetical protein